MAGDGFETTGAAAIVKGGTAAYVEMPAPDWF